MRTFFRKPKQPYPNTKVTIEHTGTKCIIELGSWDTCLEDIVEACKKAIIASGFSEESVNEYFKEE